MTLNFRRRVALATLMGVMLAAPPARVRAQESLSRPAGTQVRKWLAELADPDPEVRERAATDLMGLRRRELPVLESAVEDSRPLSPSQAVALRDIVMQVYLAGEQFDGEAAHGFMGLRWPSSDEYSPLRPGVVVVERLPGFCAYRMLQDGDVILAIDELPDAVLLTRTNLIQALQNPKISAGTTLHFRVLRRGTVRRIAITLTAKPAWAGDVGVNLAEVLNGWREKFDAYWDQRFAPLLRAKVS